MRQVLIKMFFISMLFLISVGCNNKKEFLRKDFIIKVEEALKINDSLKFNIIEKDEDLDKTLKKDFVLYYLINFISFPDKIIKEDNFKKHIEIARKINLILDEKSLDANIYEQDLKKYFLKALEIKNNKKFKNEFKIKTKKEIKEIENPKIVNDKLFGNYDEYEYVSYKIGNEIKIKKIEKKEDFYLLKDVELHDIIEEIDLEGDFNLDFENAEIIPLNSIEKKSYDIKKDNLEEISFNKFQNSFKIQDYEVGYRISKDSLSVNVMNNTKNGIFFSEFNIFSINPQIKIKKDSKNSYTYLKLGFNTNENFGFKRSNYKRIYGDFSNIKAKDIFSKIKNSFKKENDVIEKEISLFDLKVPFPNIPILNVYMRFGINVYASGKTELNFNTKHLVGFENHNDGIRIINEFEKDVNVLANASSSAIFNISLGVNSFGKRLADLRVDSGIRGEIKNTLFLYDDLNKSKEFENQLPADYLVEILNGNPNTKICSTLSLYWVLKLIFNSSGTLLNDFGITKTIDIFKDDHQVLKNKMYLENLQIVDKCDFRKNSIIKKEKIKTDINKILLKTYHKALKIDEEYDIEIINIPTDYTLDNLKFEVEKSDVVSVSKKGKVKAIKSGVCVIKIYTSDNKYSQSINILVKK